MKVRTSIFSFSVIVNLSGNWHIILMSLSLRNLMVVTINHLRRMSRHAQGNASEFPLEGDIIKGCMEQNHFL